MLWGRYGDVRPLEGMWGCHRAIWGHKGGIERGYWGDMGLLWATMGSLGGYLGDMGLLWGRYGDIKSLGGMWGCHRAIGGHKGGQQGGYRGDMGLLWGTEPPWVHCGDTWGSCGCCGVAV